MFCAALALAANLLILLQRILPSTWHHCISLYMLEMRAHYLNHPQYIL